MEISHKNCLSGYLGEWLQIMNVKACVEGKTSSGLTVPQPLQSLMRQEFNLCIMLEIFEERLSRFEMSLNGTKEDCDYGAYPEALCFLDAIYFFSRMLLGSVAGIIKHRDLGKSKKDSEFPKSFNEMYKKSVKGELPNNLNKVFSGCATWFPQLRERRDNIVHNYETNLIGIGKNCKGEKIAQQFSPRKNATGDEDLRLYIGMVMAGYQCFVDELLEYWDKMFIDMYNVSVFRHSTILFGRSANILWWAYKYGGYRNDNMFVSEP
jgi:hypothetical protein